MDSLTTSASQVSQIGSLIFQYGPSALVVFVGLILTRIAGSQLKEATTKETRRAMLHILVAVWTCVIVLVLFAVYQWFHPRRERFELRGTISTLQGSEEVNSPPIEQDRRLYVRKVYRQDGLFDVAWLLESDHELPEGDKVQFILNTGAYRAPVYELKVHRAQYERGVRIRYLRERDSLVASYGKAIEPLRRVPEDEISQLTPKHSWWPALVGEAYAAMALQPNNRAIQLEANDPVLRRNAWLALAAEGPRGVSEADRYLADPGSSQRLKLGAIAGLSTMKRPVDAGLSPAAFEAIINLGADSDPSVRAEVTSFLIKSPSPHLAAAFESRLTAARVAHDARRIAALARCGLDVYHNLGFSEEVAYKGPAQAIHFDAAVAAYRRAWELRALASPADRRWFPKALWGWGNVLHDRSWLEKRPNGSRDPARVTAAKSKFQEFIHVCETPDGGGTTPYFNQVALARAYLRNPVPASLTATRWPSLH